MLRTLRHPSKPSFVLGLLLSMGLLLLWPGISGNLFSVSGFQPHGYCFLWRPELVSLYAITDTLIGVSYVAIAGMLVCVTVEDHGPGIPAAFEQRIFQKFAEADSSDGRQKAGAGLGLSISKAIVEQLGGRSASRPLYWVALASSSNFHSLSPTWK